MRGSRLGLGMDALNRDLNGGIPGGSIVTLTAPPESSSQLILHEQAKLRTTLYLTTTRSEAAVRAELAASDVNPDNHGVFVAGVDSGDVEADALMQGCLDRIEEMLARMKNDQYSLPEQEFNIIIDTGDILEREKHGWLTKFFNRLRSLMNTVDADGLVFLHCMKGDHVPPQRDLTLSLTDVVLDLHMGIDGEDITYRLFIPKNRGGKAMMNAYKLELELGMDVDTSRDI